MKYNLWQQNKVLQMYYVRKVKHRTLKNILACLMEEYIKVLYWHYIDFPWREGPN